jgi:hypothetical protein
VSAQKTADARTAVRAPREGHPESKEAYVPFPGTYRAYRAGWTRLSMSEETSFAAIAAVNTAGTSHTGRQNKKSAHRITPAHSLSAQNGSRISNGYF